MSDFALTTVVVDNASEDTTRALIEASGISNVQSDTNDGYAFAINRVSSRIIENDYVLIINPDVKLRHDTLRLLIAGLESDDSLGAVGPVLEGPHFSPNGRRCVSWPVFCLHYVLKNAWKRNPFTLWYYNLLWTKDRENVDWLSGCCLLIRKAAYFDCEGFDDRFLLYFEDVAFGVMLRARGWSNRLVESAVADHVGGGSTATLTIKKRVFTHASSALSFYYRYYPIHKGLRRVRR